MWALLIHTLVPSLSQAPVPLGTSPVLVPSSPTSNLYTYLGSINTLTSQDGFPSGNCSTTRFSTSNDLIHIDIQAGVPSINTHILDFIRSTLAYIRNQLEIYAGFRALDLKPEDNSRRARRADDKYRIRNCSPGSAADPRHRFNRGRHHPKRIGEGVRSGTPRYLSTYAYVTPQGFLLFFAFMHILATAYIALAFICSQNLLFSISALMANKRACKSTIFFCATLHWVFPIPFGMAAALTLTYTMWHTSPILRHFTMWQLGFTCALIAHFMIRLMNTIIDHLFAPITSTLCYISRFTCTCIASCLAITQRSIRMTFFLSTYTHLLLERISKSVSPQPKAHSNQGSNTAHPPYPNDFAAALAQYVRALVADEAQNTPHAQYFSQYFVPPKGDRILSRFFSAINHIRAGFFSVAFNALLAQSKALSYFARTLCATWPYLMCIVSQAHLGAAH